MKIDDNGNITGLTYPEVVVLEVVLDYWTENELNDKNSFLRQWLDMLGFTANYQPNYTNVLEFKCAAWKAIAKYYANALIKNEN